MLPCPYMWHTYIYDPLFNILHLLIAYMPGHSAGLAIIALTLIVRFAIYPLTLKAAKAQKNMQRIAPHMEEIKQKHKDDKQAQAMAMMELYKKENVSPMSGCLPILIQLPIIFALYSIFASLAPQAGVPFAMVATSTADLLYSFVPNITPDMYFLGINLSSKNILLALIVAATQFVSSHLTLGPKKPAPNRETATFSEDMQHSMQLQARYFMPIMMGYFAYIASAAVALYWVTTNLFTIVQQYAVNKNTKD